MKKMKQFQEDWLFWNKKKEKMKFYSKKFKNKKKSLKQIKFPWIIMKII